MPSVAKTVLPPEVTEEGRSSETAEVAMEDGRSEAAKFVSSSTNRKGMTVVVDDDGSSSNIDPEEVRTFNEGFTRVEVITKGSTQNIVIPLDYNLLTNSESVVPALIPLCTGAENRNLHTFKDADLSLGISGMAL